jgi:hypothetical protein
MFLALGSKFIESYLVVISLFRAGSNLESCELFLVELAGHGFGGNSVVLDSMLDVLSCDDGEDEGADGRLNTIPVAVDMFG